MRHQLATRSDHRLWQPRQHHVTAAPENIRDEGAVGMGAHFLQVMAGAEGLAGAGDDHHSHAGVAGDGVERGLQFVQYGN